MIDRIFRVTPHIRRNCRLLSVMFNAETHRFRRIVGNLERKDGHIPYIKFHIRPYRPQQCLRYLSDRRILPYRFDGSCRRINRNAVTSCKNAQPFHMIRVFMRHQNSVHIFRGHIYFVEPALNTYAGHTDIHQHGCIVASDIDTVPAAAAAYTAELHMLITLLHLRTSSKCLSICAFVYSKSPSLSRTNVAFARNSSSLSCFAIVPSMRSFEYPRLSVSLLILVSALA